MRHLELHILQSVPVACLNRDDLGSPKTAFFGGVQRARVSSQCWKRAIRELAREIAPDDFRGMRTKLLEEPLRQELASLGLNEADARKGALDLMEAVGKLDGDGKKKNGASLLKTLFFTSPQELKTLAQAYADQKDAGKAVKKSGPSAWRDAADIALFGRMVADDHSLTVEGAAMFSHALSTHRADNELDFYSAVDDRQPDDESGAGMMGTLEFQSATYYRFAALNLDMLADAGHLGSLTPDQRRAITRAFVEATILAMPGARKNSMNANTLPGYVLAVVRGSGHPLQLVNAFERPVTAGEGRGLIQTSAERLEAEYQQRQTVWGIGAEAEYRLPGVTLAQLLDGVTSHVR